MGVTEGEEAVKEVNKFIEKIGLNISRIPKKTKKDFIDLANEDFCGDYGFTLKFLLDIYKGIIPTALDQTERAEAKADEALNQIQELKTNFPKEEKDEKTITLVNGTKIKR